VSDRCERGANGCCSTCSGATSARSSAAAIANALAEIVALLRRLNRERGLSLLIVTHDISVGRSTDRIVRMIDGEVVDEELLEVR
jgi:ABC-type dipeptide/oligopeptide/nickel transport system ATPase component